MHDLRPAARCNFECVEYAEQIYHTSSGNKSSAIVAAGARNIRPGPLKKSRQRIKHARADIGEKSQSAERVVRVPCEDVASKRITRYSKATDAEKENQSAKPFAG